MVEDNVCFYIATQLKKFDNAIKNIKKINQNYWF